MTNNFFTDLFLGHLIGDYLFQNKWMAMNKGGSSWKCAVHCLIYSLTVCSTTWCYVNGIVWFLFIFAGHFVVDRWSLADKWLDLINGRSLRDFIQNGEKDIPGELNERNYHILRGGFTALVYAVADNTIHLTMMYYGVRLFV